MRVLLPLRKVPANNHDSSSSLEEEADAVGQQQQLLQVETVDTLAGSSSSSSALADALHHPVGLDLDNLGSIEAAERLYEEEHQNLGLARAFSQALTEEEEEEEGSYEAGLRTSLVESLKALPGHKASAFYRKRKANVVDNTTTSTAADTSKACKKRPALDRKPPARDLTNNMVGGGRRVYDYGDDIDDCLRQTSTDLEDDPIENDPLENNPASARGDLLNDADFNFALALKKRGLEIRQQDGDGNCLFRAVSLQVYGDPSMHNDVRQQCLDFMERDKEHFAQFVTGEPIEGYILRKRQNGVHGNNPEIQAISELFNRPVEVFCPDNGAVPLNIFHAEYKTADAPIRLSYHDGNHYNAVVDPLVPTAGLGLGLPGLQPGLADKMQVARAVTESDAVADQMEFKRALKESQDDELQRAIKESKLSAEHMHSNEALALSDMDATYFELEQAALVRSLQSYSSSEHGKKQRASNGRRRKHGRSSPGHATSCDQSDLPVQSNSAVNNNAVASLPASFGAPAEARIPPVAAAAVASAPAAFPPAAAKKGDSPAVGTADEYPQTVQELVMNGFPLSKVVHAYEIVGDNFDNLLAFLMSNLS